MTVKSTKTLDELADCDTDALELPVLVRLQLDEPPTPGTFKNLAKLKRLGICTPEAIMALVGNAPLDPINLMATLMRIHPEGWALDVVHFAMVRVLARDEDKHITATLNVDLMGSCLVTHVLNKTNQLTVHKTLEVEPRETMLEEIQTLCNDAVFAAKREAQDRKGN